MLKYVWMSGIKVHGFSHFLISHHVCIWRFYEIIKKWILFQVLYRSVQRQQDHWRAFPDELKQLEKYAGGK